MLYIMGLWAPGTLSRSDADVMILSTPFSMWWVADLAADPDVGRRAGTGGLAMAFHTPGPLPTLALGLAFRLHCRKGANRAMAAA